MQTELVLSELANKEQELFSKVIYLYHNSKLDYTDEQLFVVFMEYKKVHKTYSDLASTNIEALKRALFIQWYELTEPNYLTGISDLDKSAKENVFTCLYEIITLNKIDNELKWMLNYYSNWSWIFEEIKSYKGFDIYSMNEQNYLMPEKIDKEQMKKRGQMGHYWNSLTIYKNI